MLVALLVPIAASCEPNRPIEHVRSPIQGQEKLGLLLQADLPLVLEVEGVELDVDGRLDLRASGTWSELGGGSLTVQRASVLVFGVDAGLLSGTATTGVEVTMGMTTTTTFSLLYDSDTLGLSADLSVIEHDRTQTSTEGGGQQYYDVVYRRGGTIAFGLTLDSGLETMSGSSISTFEGAVDVIYHHIHDIDHFPDVEIRAREGWEIVATIRTSLELINPAIDVLPVRPVFLSYSNEPTVAATGSSYGFLQAGASSVWRKAGVGIGWRPPIVQKGVKNGPKPGDSATPLTTEFCRNEETLGAPAQERQFFPDVDPTAVEIYFCSRFDPRQSRGGGQSYVATAPSGFIVLSDELEDYVGTSMSDPSFTDWGEHVLAHELGHTLGLDHPNAISGNAGSPGSVMCTSPSWGTDVPSKQSTYNASRVLHTLLVGAFFPPASSTDCDGDGVGVTCGSCP